MSHKEESTPAMPSSLWMLVSDVKDYQTIEEYKVGQIKVSITKDGRYIVNEPNLTPAAEDAYNKIHEHMIDHADNPDYATVTKAESQEDVPRFGQDTRDGRNRLKVRGLDDVLSGEGHRGGTG